MVVRPYKARTAFSDLTNRVIYLNEYLIDDEEVVEYLTLSELMHIKLNMYPSRYGDSSYAEKFDLLLCLGSKLRGLERMEKLREANRRLR